MTKKELEIRCEVMKESLNRINELCEGYTDKNKAFETIGAIMAQCDPVFFREAYQLENVILTNRKEKTYNIPKKGVQVMDEEMTAIEMQKFLNQQYAEGKTELEAYRNLMAILGLSYPQKSEKEK